MFENRKQSDGETLEDLIKYESTIAGKNLIQSILEKIKRMNLNNYLRFS
jgi:hypothetical protein